MFYDTRCTVRLLASTVRQGMVDTITLCSFEKIVPKVVRQDQFTKMDLYHFPQFWPRGGLICKTVARC